LYFFRKQCSPSPTHDRFLYPRHTYIHTLYIIVLSLWFYHSPPRLRNPFPNYTWVILLLCKINICIVLSRNEHICITRLPIEYQDLIIFAFPSTPGLHEPRAIRFRFRGRTYYIHYCIIALLSILYADAGWITILKGLEVVEE